MGLELLEKVGIVHGDDLGDPFKVITDSHGLDFSECGRSADAKR